MSLDTTPPIQQPKYTPISELEPEEQVAVQALETKTDEVYRLRTQLVDFYRRYYRYLNPIPGQAEPAPVLASKPEEKEKEKRYRLVDLQHLFETKKSIDEAVDWNKVRAEAEEKYKDIPEEDRELKIEAYEDEVRVEFGEAVVAFEELYSNDGVWDEFQQLNQGAVDTKDYYRMRWQELGSAIKALEEIDAKVARVEAKKESTRNPALIRAYATQYEDLRKQKTTLLADNPEAYIYEWSRRLKEAKQAFDKNGRMIETPYVKARIYRVEAIVRSNRPVFIHGELGTGKTEFAKHISRTRLSQEHVTRWEREHPKPTNPDELNKWEALRAQEAEALVVSGHRGLEAYQVLGARSVTRAEALSPEKQLEQINDRWTQYHDRMVGEFTGSEKDKKEFEKKLNGTDRPLLEKAYLEAFRSPVETMEKLGPLLLAMKQGRPLIIDEINAIPHHVLIIMNDLLLVKPGEMVTPPIPGSEPFVVQQGFCVLATGNYKPEDGVMYVGRQQIDAAFLSRLGVVTYDYLPSPGTLEAPGLSPEDSRQFRQSNELYKMIVTRLLNNDLSIKLPEDGFKKLKALVYCAKQIQDIFCGMNTTLKGKDRNNADIKAQDWLKENVLSIRHLIPIVERWKTEGFVHDLDYYVFQDYVARSRARETEMYNLYNLLKIQGDFFPDDKGWPPAWEINKVLQYNIDEKMYGIDRATGMRTQESGGGGATLKLHSPKEVIEELFGRAPTRTKLSARYINRKKNMTEELIEPLEDLATRIERARLLAEIQEGMEELKGDGIDLQGEADNAAAAQPIIAAADKLKRQGIN